MTADKVAAAYKLLDVSTFGPPTGAASAENTLDRVRFLTGMAADGMME